MKRIISLFLAALILLGTIASSIMMVAYADEDTSSSEAEDEKEKPDGVHAGGDIYIESYDYDAAKERLTIVMIDAGYDPDLQLPDDTYLESFYAAL
ncbi:MAG: hypothetical protein IIX70_03670, partial [Oscillospiraceae bacterium]|nr:hypothetical protein [Oscillospiraceae bacterium]